MIIGIPKETKPQENRVGLTANSVKSLVDDGHEVIIETNIKGWKFFGALKFNRNIPIPIDP